MVLVGPTSSGKSSLALTLAETFPMELVCMDSMQIYKEPAVGTARPTTEEMQRAPHHLYGFTSVREKMSAYRWAAIAAQTVAEIQERGRIPLLVGGTGLYMRALFEGLHNLPATPDALRARLEGIAARRGRPWLYRMLQRLDPAGADHLHANDSQRIQRFLEVRLMTGKGMLEHWAHQRQNARPKPLVIGLDMPREILDRRIEKQVECMLDGGWIEETTSLLRQNLLECAVKTGPIGYAEVASLIAGNLTRAQAQQRIYLATRRYAKRQMTWFRKASYIQWFPFHPDSGYNTLGITEVVQGNMG